jgi:hypothetical protein
MSLSKTALDARPTRPVNAYFKFRNQYINENKEKPDRTAMAKKLWDDMD